MQNASLSRMSYATVDNSHSGHSSHSEEREIGIIILKAGIKRVRLLVATDMTFTQKDRHHGNRRWLGFGKLGSVATGGGGPR